MSVREEIRAVLESEYGLVPELPTAGRRGRRISPEARIGKNVSFGYDAIVSDDVELGDNVQIGDRVTLRNCRIAAGARIEDNCIIGYQTLTGGFTHKFAERKQVTPTVIGEETLVRTGSILYQSVTVGRECWINHMVMLREHTQIGDRTCIGTMAESEGYNRIGNHCLIESQVHLCSKMTIKDYVFIAPFTIFTNGNPMNYARDFVSEEQGPTVGFGVQIAVHVNVLPRVVIGDEALIGASAVVTRDVPALGIVLGVPGRVVGRVAEDRRMPVELRRKYYDGNLDPAPPLAPA
jgi:UDP-2-acetamido-3-amino-2,3-dideoxy-glucuronate N-acetyltransferase